MSVARTAHTRTNNLLTSVLGITDREKGKKHARTTTEASSAYNNLEAFPTVSLTTR